MLAITFDYPLHGRDRVDAGDQFDVAILTIIDELMKQRKIIAGIRTRVRKLILIKATVDRVS
jgi:hypothetical protein